jgi:hypothetical protein
MSLRIGTKNTSGSFDSPVTSFGELDLNTLTVCLADIVFVK